MRTACLVHHRLLRPLWTCASPPARRCGRAALRCAGGGQPARGDGAHLLRAAALWLALRLPALRGPQGKCRPRAQGRGRGQEPAACLLGVLGSARSAAPLPPGCPVRSAWLWLSVRAWGLYGAGRGLEGASAAHAGPLCWCGCLTLLGAPPEVGRVRRLGPDPPLGNHHAAPALRATLLRPQPHQPHTPPMRLLPAPGAEARRVPADPGAVQPAHGPPHAQWRGSTRAGAGDSGARGAGAARVHPARARRQWR